MFEPVTYKTIFRKSVVDVSELQEMLHRYCYELLNHEMSACTNGCMYKWFHVQMVACTNGCMYKWLHVYMNIH